MVNEFIDKLQDAFNMMRKVEIHFLIPNGFTLDMCFNVDSFCISKENNIVICSGNTELKFDLDNNMVEDDGYYISNVNGGKMYVCFH